MKTYLLLDERLQNVKKKVQKSKLNFELVQKKVGTAKSIQHTPLLLFQRKVKILKICL